MAITTQNSTQYANAFPTTGPNTLNDNSEWESTLRRSRFDFTQSGAGDAGSLVRTIKLPPGKVRLYLRESFIVFSAMGTARTLDIGWLAYTNLAGTAVAADPNGLDDGVDVSSAGTLTPGGTLANDEESMTFESKGGVVITLQVNDGTLPDAATFNGYFSFCYQ